MKFAPFLISALLAALVPQTGSAQEYPNRPVRIVVPSTAGGGTDVLVRAIANELSNKWGQSVIVDNKPGAGGTLGASFVAKATPDGYTLLGTIDSSIVANRFLYKSLAYDPDKDFAPLVLLVQANQMLLALPSVPANDLREFVELVKREKGKYLYGSYGNSTQPHFAYEMLNKQEGLDLVHVPYKGVAPVITAMLSNEIQLTMGSAAVATKLIQAGKLKPLAVAGTLREPKFPNLKTTVEQGFPYLQISLWHGLLAPAGTPEAIRRKIAEDVIAILKAPGFAEKHADGFVTLAEGPEAFTERIKRDVERIQNMLKVSGIKPE